MSNADVILEFLEANPSGRYCDDCLSSQLGITPRQQVNQIGNTLLRQGAIQRRKGRCTLCGKYNKIVNYLEASTPAAPQPELRRGPLATRQVLGGVRQGQIDIENLRTRIVRMCHEIWQAQKKENPPRSISAVINILKDEGLLPKHQANMMLTLCHLRNVYVYDGIEIGPSEKAVAEGAYSIVAKWWESWGAGSP